MSRFITLIIFSFLSTGVWAQQGSIRGFVKNEKGEALASSTVTIEGAKLSTLTSDQGEFQFQHIKPGNYRLLVTMIGYDLGGKKITVSAGQETVVEFKLAEGSLELQTVEITGRKENTYRNTQSFLATKTATALKDVPQAVSYVTKELMQDQQAFRMGDVVKNISGVNSFSGYDDYTLRGFRSNTMLLNGLKVAASFWNQPLLVNMERVEVIKGPAAALFGNTDPGGTINRVTKKPLDVDRKTFAFTVGSFQTYRGTMDITGPINESKTVLYRVNAGYENTETFKTNLGSESFIVSPSISFAPNEKTSVNLDLVFAHTNSKLYRGQPIFGASAGTDLYSTPISFTIGRASDYQKEKNFSATVSVSHKFSESFSVNFSYLKFLYNENLMEHRTSNSYAVDSAGKEISTLMQMQTIRRISKNYNDNLTSYAVKKFRTGPLDHQLLIGYDYNQFSVPVGGSSETARGYKLKNGTVANTYNKAKKDDYVLDSKGNPVPNVPHFDLVNPDYSMANTSAYITTSTATAPARSLSHGIYIQDQIKWNRWSLLLGLRKEFFVDKFNFEKANEQDVRQESLIPRIGLVYSLTRDINLYATWVEGFMPQATASMTNPRAGGPFSPLVSRMYEAGAKGDFLRGRLSATVAVYHLEQNNVLVNAANPTNPDSLLQRGQDRGRGVELDINGRITNDLFISANYAYSKTIIAKSTIKEQEGRIKENAPLHQGGIWAKYQVSDGKLKGFGIGAGSNFVTKRNTFSTVLTLPGYVILDAAVYYRFEKVQLAVNFNNILDKTHWEGGYDFNRLFPGAPRNFLATISYTL